MLMFAPLKPRQLKTGQENHVHDYHGTIKRLMSLRPIVAPIIADGPLNPSNEFIGATIEAVGKNVPGLTAEREALQKFCDEHANGFRIQIGDYDETPSDAAGSLCWQYGEVGYLVGLMVGMRLGNIFEDEK